MMNYFNFKNFFSKSLILAFFFCLTTTTTAQTDNDYWKQRYQILEENDGIATVLDRHTGETFPYCITPPENIPAAGRVDTLYAPKTMTIDTRNIDTTRFKDRFILMGTVPIYGRSGEVLVYDSDGNGLGEIIGQHKPLGTFWNVYNEFYEWDGQTNEFKQVVDFGVIPEIKGGRPLMGGDIDQDGYREVYMSYGDSLRVYEATDSSRYAAVHRYSHQPVVAYYPSGNKMGDFDGDGKFELLNMRDNIDTTGVNDGISAIIREHVTGDTGFVVTTNLIYPPNFGGYGRFAVGDFDLDGKTEIFKANIFGKVAGIENVSNDSFRIHYQAQLPTLNASYHFSAGDLDGDGFPECFLGGDHSEYSIKHNLITILESCGNDCYEAVLAIDILGGWGIYGRKIVHGDVDGDGVDEFAVDIGGMVLMFKAKGNDDYELFWVKHVTYSDGIGMGDVDGDGYSEIIIAQSIWVNGDPYSKSSIYKYDPGILSVRQHNLNIPNQSNL